MQHKILMIVSVLLITISISLSLFPTLSKTIIQKHSDNIIEDFDRKLNDIQEGSFYENSHSNTDKDEYQTQLNKNSSTEFTMLYKEDLDHLYLDSLNYNKELSKHQDFRSGFEGSALDLSQYGIFNGLYGYVSAEAIGLHIPIYLGATESNMLYGCAQLLNTSLPIGGTDTKTILAGHTAYIGRTLFDNISALSLGDIVTVTNYFDTLNYKVVDEKNINSTDLEYAYIEEGKDLLILLTCSNGGSTRYIVVCERIN